MVTEMSIDKESKEATQSFDPESGGEQQLPTATMPADSAHFLVVGSSPFFLPSFILSLL
jgi:hypothetical protein